MTCMLFLLNKLRTQKYNYLELFNIDMQIALFLLILVIHKSATINPVLMVPGDGGSILMARYIKPPPHFICGVTGNWFMLWLNVYFITPLTIDCFVHIIKLEYDPLTRTTFSPDFCETKVEGFGTSDSMEYFSYVRLKSTSYFYYIIVDLVQKLGYIPNKSIRGAPYDFRKAPSEMGEFFTDFKELIEQMYAENNDSPVILMGHSMGNLYIVRLLNSMSQQWKDKYIKSLISISGPYAGAVDAIRTAVSGNNQHINILSSIELRDAQSSWPSTYYLMPIPEIWSQDPLVATKEGNFTADSISELLISTGIAHADEHYENIRRSEEIPAAPNVPVYCIYTDNVPTPEFLDYRYRAFPNKQPLIKYGLGDGTVNLASLRHCTNWQNEQQEPVTTHTIPGVEHLEIMRDDRLTDLINQIIWSDK